MQASFKTQTEHAPRRMKRLRASVALLVAGFERFARRAPARFSLLTVAGLFALALVTLSPSYDTKDDPWMAMFAAGKGASLAPDEHLVFTNVVIGLALKFLYTALPAVAWYGLYLAATQYLALSAILYAVIASGYSRLRLALFALFFAIVGIVYFNNVQYTSTAALAAQAGLLLWLVSVEGRQSNPRSSMIAQLACGVALLVLASLIRLESMIGTVLIAAPAVAVTIWPLRKGTLMRLMASAALGAVVVLGFAVYHDAYYNRDPGWREFLRFNKTRVKFNDYGWTRYTPETAHVFDAVGWSENDHALIADWFFDNAQVYSEAHLERVLESYPWPQRRQTPAHHWRSVRDMLLDKSLWPSMLAAPLLIWCLARTQRNVLMLAVTSVLIVAILCGVAIFLKPPPGRVYFPALTFPLVLALMNSRASVDWPRRRFPALAVRCFITPVTWFRPGARVLLHPTLIHAVLIVAVVGTVMAANRQLRRSRTMQAARHAFYETVARIAPQDDQLYVAFGKYCRYDALSPFDSFEKLKNFHLFIVAWPQRTPICEAIKQRFGASDVLRAALDCQNVRLLVDPSTRPLCEQYLREHYRQSIQFAEFEDRCGDRFELAGRDVALLARGKAPTSKEQAPKRYR
ncbi:MAG TPA: hypothetical protein VGN12_19695 [Pirellulales bacterium]